MFKELALIDLDKYVKAFESFPSLNYIIPINSNNSQLLGYF